MLAEGWRTIDPEAQSADVGQFVRPLADRFLAIAFFPWYQPQNSNAIRVAARLGIDYEPARDLLHSLTGSPICGIVLREPADQVSISNIRDVEASTNQLVHFIASQFPVVVDLADVDPIIKLLFERRAMPLMHSMMPIYAGDVTDTEPGEPAYLSSEPELIPALLTASGRYGEARRALTEVGKGDPSQTTSPHHRRFARQLGRLLGAGGKFDLPSTPPRWPPYPIAPEPQASARTLHQSQAEQEALDAVRAIRKRHESREELRALLETEIDARNLQMAPLDIVTAVDILFREQEPHGTAYLLRNIARDATHLASLVVDLAVSKPRHAEPLVATLPWLEPPDRAAYPIWMITGSWVEVELDKSANDWLKQAWDAAPGSGARTRDIKVWLTWASDPPTADTHLNVHLGIKRIGQLTPDSARHFQLPMEAAAQRDEDPWARARLSTISSDQPLLLEVAVPKGKW
jgi:hypothetical protein